MIKKIYITAGLIIIIAFTVVHADKNHGPLLTFSTPEYDFGTVYFNEVRIKRVEIEFSNTGDKPLLISDIKSCCGTVVTYWPKEPILPGETEKIKVRFRIVKKPSSIRRVISVHSNSVDNASKRYHITGRIQQSPE